jgi:hypothetical protein
MKRALLLAVGLAAASLTVAGPAYASCAELPPVERSVRTQPFVFVGEVISTSSEGRVATVEVHEVWNGAVSEGTVEVVGGEEDPGVSSSVDRTYTTGAEYLFVPFDRKGGRFRDNICTATQEWSADLEELRPGSIEVLTPGPSPTASKSAGFPLLPVAGVGLLLVAIAYLVLRVRATRG